MVFHLQSYKGKTIMVFHLKSYKGETINETLNNAFSIYLREAPLCPT
jgi:hypothetical protein